MSEEWICTDCEYPYHEPPPECQICGHEVVVPREEYDRRTGGVRGALARARARVLEPTTIDRSLVGSGPVVQAVFLTIVMLTVAVAVFLLATLLFG